MFFSWSSYEIYIQLLISGFFNSILIQSITGFGYCFVKSVPNLLTQTFLLVHLMPPQTSVKKHCKVFGYLFGLFINFNESQEFTLAVGVTEVVLQPYLECSSYICTVVEMP